MTQTLLLIDSLAENQNVTASPDYLELTWEQRSKARHKASTVSGVSVALSLPRGTYLHDGAVLYNSGDLAVVVKAKPEAILRIQPRSAEEACRVAHHLGNWHRSIAIQSGEIYAQPDGPLKDWLTRQSVPYEPCMAPFEPNLRCASHD